MDGPSRELTPAIRFAYYARRQAKDPGDGPAWRACFQCFRVFDGALQVAGLARVMRPGQAVICDPGTVVTPLAGARYSRLVFDLLPRPTTIDARGLAQPEHWQPQPSWLHLFQHACPGLWPDALCQRWDHRLHQIVTARLRDPLEHLTANMQLGTLVAELVAVAGGHRRRGQRQRPKPSLPAPVLALEERLARDLAAGQSIAQVASAMGYAPAYLSRLYRQTRGRTISDYLRLVRAKQAQRLLSDHPDYTLDQIAAAVGLGSSRSLQRCLIAEFGQPPSILRRGMTQGDQR